MAGLTAQSAMTESPGLLLIAYKLSDKHVLIIGAGKEAYYRTQKALIANARITIISPELTTPLFALVQQNPERLHWLERDFNDTDLNDNVHAHGKIDMVLSVLSDHDQSELVYNLAKLKNIPINCADIPPLCDFNFMAEYKDGPVQIAVSTGGNGPRLAGIIRTKIQASLPVETGLAVSKMGKIRQLVKNHDPGFASETVSRRMDFFSRLCDDHTFQQLSQLTDDDFSDILACYDLGEAYHYKQKSGASLLFSGAKRTIGNLLMTPPATPQSVASLLPSTTSPSSPSITPSEASSMEDPTAFSNRCYKNIKQLFDIPVGYASTFLLDTFDHLKKDLPFFNREKAVQEYNPQYQVSLDNPTFIEGVKQPRSGRPSTVGDSNEPSGLNKVSATFRSLKEATEVGLSNNLNKLPEAFENPIRSLITYLPIPYLRVPAKIGTIYLVGAGPGDPDLLTLAALKIIQKCDVLISDQLIPPPLINFVKSQMSSGSLFTTVPKKSGSGGKSDLAQDATNLLVLKYLNDGRTVCRLKNGDPFLYGRGGEEYALFTSKGFTCKVSPGISSAMAVPLSANIPLTHRSVADQVLILSGRGENGDFPVIPTFTEKRTTVVLMCIGRLSKFITELIKLGYPETLPCAIIEKGTWDNNQERVIRSNLENIVRIAKEKEVTSPGIFVVGDTVNVLQDLGMNFDDL